MLERARRVALTYRAALVGLHPDAAADIDDWAIQHGQSWVNPSEWPWADDDMLTLQEAADACQVERSTVYRWHQRGLPYTATPDGLRIRVRDLLDFEQQRRRARRA